MRILSVVRQDCNPIGPFFCAFCHFLCLLQLIFARFWGRGVVYRGISARFMPQASSGTVRADGPMDFAVRDEPAWIPSREKARVIPRRGGVVPRTREDSGVFSRPCAVVAVSGVCRRARDCP